MCWLWWWWWWLWWWWWWGDGCGGCGVMVVVVVVLMLMLLLLKKRNDGIKLNESLLHSSSQSRRRGTMLQVLMAAHALRSEVVQVQRTVTLLLFRRLNFGGRSRSRSRSWGTSGSRSRSRSRSRRRFGCSSSTDGYSRGFGSDGSNAADLDSNAVTKHLLEQKSGSYFGR